MFRLGMMTCLVLGCALVSNGCNKPKKSAAPDTQSPDMYAGGYDTGYQNPSTLTGMDTSSTGTVDDSSTASTAGQRIHVVAKGDTLFSLARKYYGDQKRWKDIYAANQAQIPNPDVIKVGQKLVIP